MIGMDKLVSAKELQDRTKKFALRILRIFSASLATAKANR